MPIRTWVNLSSYWPIVWPPFENDLSDGVDVAGMHSLIYASLASLDKSSPSTRQVV